MAILRSLDVADLKRRHPLPGVVASTGIVLRQSGQVMMGCCPFHDDHEPSLLVDPRDDHYHCFACGAHGDVLDFLQRRDGIAFRQSVERLIGTPAGPATMLRSVVRRTAGSPGGRRRSRPLGPAEHACLAAAVKLYEQQLLATPRVYRYALSRGLTWETMARYRLGYAAGETLLPELRRQGLSIPAARRVGLLDRLGHERLAERLVVPELRDGQPIWLIGRALGANGAGPRYLGLPGNKPLLGWDDAAGATLVFLTEGPFDWLTLRQWGYPALALVGTSVRPEVLCSLDRFQRVTLVLDNDVAGRAATVHLAQNLGERAVCIPLPAGVKDVAELALRPDGQVLFARAAQHTALPRAA